MQSTVLYVPEDQGLGDMNKQTQCERVSVYSEMCVCVCVCETVATILHMKESHPQRAHSSLCTAEEANLRHNMHTEAVFKY